MQDMIKQAPLLTQEVALVKSKMMLDFQKRYFARLIEYLNKYKPTRN